MRFLLRKIVSATNASFTRVNTIRFSSGEAKNKPEEPKPDEKKVQEVIKYVHMEKSDSIRIVSIDRVGSRNSLNEQTLRQLGDAVDQFEMDPEAKVLILHGEGGTFSSGFDIKELDEKGYNALKDASHRLARRPICVKPTIAAVSGYAVGEGLQLALACDLRVIEDGAVLGFLERRFGVPQTLGGDRRLTSLVGLSRSLELLMTGKMFSGCDAHRYGLATKLTATGTALGEAVKLAKCIAKFPQNALIMDKLGAVNSVLNPNSEESMRDEAMKESFLGAAIEDIKAGAKKFVVGIGRHGKAAELTEMPLKDWELETTSRTTKICVDDKPPQPGECKKE